MKNKRTLTGGIVLLLCLLVCIAQLAGNGFVSHAMMTTQEYMAYIEEASQDGDVYIVDQTGAGDFDTVSEAVAAAQSGDTIFIFPGTYTEAVTVGDKGIALIGLDRDTCILEYPCGSYYSVPLNIGAGKVANLTIHAVYSGKSTQDKTDLYSSMTIEDRSTIQLGAMNGYAIHIDNDYLYGKDLTFENCRIISDENYCVGLGCRGESTVTFEGCEFTAKEMSGCIYVHNTDVPFLGGDAYVTVRNCSMTNYRCPYVMTFHSFGDTNRIFLTFQNVRVATVAYEKKIIYSDTNLYTGFDVETLSKLQQNGSLNTNGLMTSVLGELVHEYDISRSNEYLEEVLNPTTNNAVLAEGITYLRMAGAEYESDEYKDRIKSTICIYNDTGEVGEGWCGLNCIYLTADSYGNTLVEMNLPVMPPYEEAEQEESKEENPKSNLMKEEGGY